MKWELFSDELVEKRSHYCEPVTFEKVFSAEECNQIIALHTINQHEKSVMNWGASKPQKRDTDLFWVTANDQSSWLFYRVIDLISKANEMYFNFIFDGSIANFQLGRYQQNQNYDWHQDLGSNLESRRKLSIAIQLSDPKTYEGGDLQFFRNEGDNLIIARDRGCATIFPSWMIHRVTPVERGERWSLVNWILGPPFR